MGILTLTYGTDNEIMKYAKTGEAQRSANEFVRKHQKFVYAVAYRYLKNEEDAEDIAQEAFINALKSMESFRGDSDVKTWLYRITVNLCNNALRKKKMVSFFRYGDKEDTEEFYNIADEDDTPYQSVERSEFREQFHKALNALPPKQRETFVLRYFEEMPYEEISKMLGTSTGALKANFFHAMKKISAELKKYQLS